MKKITPFYPLVLLLVLYSFTALGQMRSGSLRGTAIDKTTGEVLPFVNVVIYDSDSIAVAGGTTDIDGKYNINPLKPGTYRLKATCVGYTTISITEIVVSSNYPTLQDLKLSEESEMLSEAVILYEVPLIDKVKSSKVATAASISRMAVRDVTSVSAQAAGVTQDANGNTNIRGARGEGTIYFIDGVKVRGNVNLPQASIASQEVIMSGTPAIYGSEEIANMACRDISSVPGIQMDTDYTPSVDFIGGPGSSTVWTYHTPTSTWTPVSINTSSSVAPETPQEKFRGEYYKSIPENDFLGSFYEPLSTFGADVDVASYANVRRMLMSGSLPHPDAVRLEEFINYFQYDYPEPEGDLPFSVNIDQRTCDWNPNHKLLRIGLKTASPEQDDLPPSNLVFLIDVSGSMSNVDKLPLLQTAMKIMVKQLRDDDRVAIVVYASSTGLVLESTPASDRSKILSAIDRLSAGGSTAGGAGIQLAYKVAQEHFIKEGNNRVVLATDGDFNVGVSSDEGLIELIEEKRKTGVFLSVLGFGTGNYQDAKMEQLADHGNGNYAYIDGLLEARKVLATELGANMHVVAKDTKFQIEFNPQKVSAHRLLGYENRILAAEDFNDDLKDAGDIGAGHTVTAVYEIIPRIPESDSIWVEEPQLRYQDKSLNEKAYGEELALLKIRYKEPDEEESKLSIHPVFETESADPDFAFLSAVLQYALLLRQSEYAGNSSLESAIALAERHLGPDPHGYRREFIQLCRLAKDLQ